MCPLLLLMLTLGHAGLHVDGEQKRFTDVRQITEYVEKCFPWLYEPLKSFCEEEHHNEDDDDFTEAEAELKEVVTEK